MLYTFFELLARTNQCLRPTKSITKAGSMSDNRQFDLFGHGDRPTGSPDLSHILGVKSSEVSTDAILMLMEKDPKLSGFVAAYRTRNGAPPNGPLPSQERSFEDQLHNMTPFSDESFHDALNLPYLPQSIQGSFGSSSAPNALFTSSSSSATPDPFSIVGDFDGAESLKTRTTNTTNNKGDFQFGDLSDEEGTTTPKITRFATSPLHATNNDYFGPSSSTPLAGTASSAPPSFYQLQRNQLSFSNLNSPHPSTPPPTPSFDDFDPNAPNSSFDAIVTTRRTSPAKAFANAAPYTPVSSSLEQLTASYLMSSAPKVPSPPSANAPMVKSSYNTGYATPSAPSHSDHHSSVASPPAPLVFGVASIAKHQSASAASASSSISYASAVQQVPIITHQQQQQQQQQEQQHRSTLKNRSTLRNSSLRIPIGRDYLDTVATTDIECGQANGLCVMTLANVAFETSLTELLPILEEVYHQLAADLKDTHSSSLLAMRPVNMESPVSVMMNEHIDKPRLFGAVCRCERSRVHYYLHVFDRSMPVLKLFERLILEPKTSQLETISRIYPVTSASHPDIDFFQTCVQLISEHPATIKVTNAMKALLASTSSSGSGNPSTSSNSGPSAFGSARPGTGPSQGGRPANSLSGALPRLTIGLALESHRASEFAQELSTAIRAEFGFIDIVERNPMQCDLMLSGCYFNSVFLTSLWEPINTNDLNNYRPSEMRTWAGLHPQYVPRTPFSGLAALRHPIVSAPSQNSLRSSSLSAVPRLPSGAIPPAIPSLLPGALLSNSNRLGAANNTNPTSAFGAIGTPSTNPHTYAGQNTAHSHANAHQRANSNPILTQQPIQAPHAPLLNISLDEETQQRARNITSHYTAASRSSNSSPSKNVPGGKRNNRRR